MPKGITKRKDGRYVIRKTINGIRQVYYSKTLEQAKKIYTKIKNNLLTKNETIIYTFEKWSNEWIENYKKPFIKELSYRDIKNIIALIIKKFGKCKLQDLTTNSIQTYINSLKKNRTKERICLYFNACLQKAFELGHIAKNPFVNVIKDKKIKFKRNAYTYQEQVILINAIKNTILEIPVMTYLMTGCRPSELPSKTNFDLINNIVHIYGTKNDSSKHREIDISNEYANYIKKYFTNNDIPKYSEIQKEYSVLCNQIGINTSLYTLRHTFATNMRVMGADTKIIAYYLGHSSIQMTLDIYTDIDRNLTKDKLNKLYNNLYKKF